MNPNPRPRVSLAFTERTGEYVLVFGRNVVTQLTGNPNFTTPFPTLATVTTALDDLETKIAEALDGGRLALAARRASKASALSLLRQLAAWVQAHSAGDVNILVTSGFEPVKGQSPIGPLPAPYTAILRQGSLSGSIDARTPKVKGAYSYNWRLALASAPTVFLQEVQTTAARHRFEGLTPGQTYIVQVSAVGAAGDTNWSPLTSMMVV